MGLRKIKNQTKKKFINLWKAESNYYKTDNFYKNDFYFNESNRHYFQFLPGYPIILALFDKLSGEYSWKYALNFLNLLNIFGFYCLLKILNINKKISLYLTLLFTTNPVFCFFSKFPASEIFALYLFINFITFSVILFLKNKINFYNIILFLILFFIFCFTRISAVLLLSITFALIIYYKLNAEDIKKEVNFIPLYILVIFVFSQFIIYKFNPHYLIENYDFIFSETWITYLSIYLIFVTSLTLFSRKNNLLGSSLSFCIEKINIITLVTIFALITFIFIYLPFNLGVFFESYQASKNVSPLDFYKTNSVTIFLKYFCFLLIILFLFEKFELTSTKKFFLIVFLCSILFFFPQNQVPYQYYFTRYQLVELFPIFFVLVAFQTNLKNKLHKFIYLAVIIYNIIITLPQTFYTEAESSAEFLSQFNQNYFNDNTNNLVILNYDEPEKSFLLNRIRTPLRYYFDQDLIITNNNNLKKILDLNFLNRFDRILVITEKNIELNSLDLIRNFTYPELHLDHVYNSLKFPTKFISIENKFYLYEFDKLKKFLNDLKFGNKLNIYNTSYPNIVKLSGIHGDQIWTKDKFFLKINNVNVSKKFNFMLISLQGWYPFKNKLKQNIISIKINKVKIESEKIFFDFDKNQIKVDIKDLIDEDLELEIELNTFNPKNDLGTNDTRDLGIDLKYIELIN